MPRRTTRLVVGLGNPGREYERTRHNVGFRVLDHLALREGLLFESPSSLEEYEGPEEFLWARSYDPDALLVKPVTFMNASGEVVGPLLEWSGARPKDLMVVFDDMDLPVGRLRIRPRGGPGGQKGMGSIIETLGTEDFPRLRVGIGRPETDAARHVLSGFDSEEERVIRAAVPEAVDAILFWLRTGDLERCMTRFHSRWKEGVPRP